MALEYTSTAEAALELPPQYGAEEEDGSPLGSALRMVRRARAFGKQAAAPAAPPLAAAAVEGAKAVVVGSLPGSSMDDPAQLGVISMLPPPPPRGAQGFTQEQLDAMAVVEEVEEEEEEDVRGVPVAEEYPQDEDLSDRAEDMLLRCKRLRAYDGATAAAAFVASVANVEPPETAVTPDNSTTRACDDDGPESPIKHKKTITSAIPEALCYMVRRTRAFQGAEVAEMTAKKLMANVFLSDPAIESDAAAGDVDRSSERPRKPAVMLPARSLLSVPEPLQHGPRSTSPSSLSPNASKDSSDPVAGQVTVQVATPNRKRLSESQASLGLSPTRGGA